MLARNGPVGNSANALYGIGLKHSSLFPRCGLVLLGATSGAMLLMRAIHGAHPAGVLRTSYFAVLRNGGYFWLNKSGPAGRANK